MKWFTSLFKKTSLVPTTNAAQGANAFDKIGGESTVKALARSFYQEMRTNPETKRLLDIHRLPLAKSEEKLYEFLTGWLGGPPLYQNKYGHPALRARHLPFQIDDDMRDQWLMCMKIALEKEVTELQHRQAIFEAISQLADHMRNQ